jgi:hypothetical protein
MYGELRYKFGISLVSLVRRLWRKPTEVESWSILLNRHIFLVTSTLNPPQGLVSLPTRRGVFSSGERLEQTLASIASVRAKVPGALIVLLENSDLVDSQARILQEAVDWLVRFDADPRSRVFRDHGNKGVGEAYMLKSIVKVLHRFDYCLLFKLSARYRLSDRFALQHFPLDRFGFLPRDGVASTRLYSVPRRLHRQYARQLVAAFLAGRLGVSIEAVIARGLSRSQVGWLDPIGVSGHLGDGGWIDE